jgi:predicted PhzF superfamily epimerase YddE/YHI9
MRLPLFQIDAFTSRLFGGNPAAVVLLDDWLADAVLLAIAAENNLSETAFVIPREDISPLRWFTPALEMDLCGHATLAAADVLLRHRFPGAQRVRFATRSGELAVERAGDALRMDFPERPGTAVEVTQAMSDALGRTPVEAWLARDLMLVFADEDEIRSLEPDIGRVAALDAFAVIATAPGRAVDFVSRFFAPRAGIAEDPVTGSAHCTLVPYWAQRLGRSTLQATQLSARGGELSCEMRGQRVLMSGHCVEYLRGEIELP